MARPFPIHVVPGGELPIYRQIMRQVIEGIAGGHLRPDDKLPSHRELAEALVIAPLTIKKAYDELEREGYVRSARGQGTFVSPAPPLLAEREKRDRLRATVRQLVREAAVMGVSFSRLQALVEEEERKLRAEQQRGTAAEAARRRK